MEVNETIKCEYIRRENIIMKKYRLLALDLDDTLLTKDKQISVENRKWINKAREAGVTVMFATGRGMQTVEHLLEELALSGPMVLVNGAEVWAGASNLLERHYIGKEDIRILHSLAEKAGAQFWGYSVESLTHKKDWKDEMFDCNWMKFGIRHNDLSVIKQLREQAKMLPNIDVTRSANTNMEISLSGISKESGVRRICDHLRIEMDEVMAMGDNLNDSRLIQAAGFGIAMGNADPELKNVADAITGHHEQDGVADAIKRYLFGIE